MRLIERCDALRGVVVELLGLSRLMRRSPVFEVAAPPPGGPPDAAAAEITVIVPSFQHEQYIEHALRSILQQSHQAYKILVVDDASTDATVARARSVVDARITILVNPRNVGLGSSLTSALTAVDTPLVAILNSDDLYHPDRLQRCCERLQSDQSLQVVATAIELMDSRGRRLDAANVSRLLDGLRIFHWIRWYDGVRRTTADAQQPFLGLLQHNSLLTSSNVVGRTDFLRRHADRLAGLLYCLDWHLFLAAAADGQLGLLTEPLLGYRLHTSNTVWFDDTSRPAYEDEVQRVAAEAVSARIAALPPGERPEALADIALRLRYNDAIDPGEVDNLLANLPDDQ